MAEKGLFGVLGFLEEIEAETTGGEPRLLRLRKKQDADKSRNPLGPQDHKYVLK